VVNVETYIQLIQPAHGGTYFNLSS